VGGGDAEDVARELGHGELQAILSLVSVFNLIFS